MSTSRRRAVASTSRYQPILRHLNCTILKRFWAKVDRRAPDECWDWTGSRSIDGYGHFKVGGFETRPASRVAWVIANKRDAGDMLVRHKCDRPCCCNPDHLELGTARDNAADMVERGRASRRVQAGEANNAAQLTAAEVGEIVEAFRRREQNMTIALRYPVGHSLISRIRTGRSWQREAAQYGWEPAVAYLERTAA